VLLLSFVLFVLLILIVVLSVVGKPVTDVTPGHVRLAGWYKHLHCWTVVCSGHSVEAPSSDSVEVLSVYPGV
jgi:hypothetical protein